MGLFKRVSSIFDSSKRRDLTSDGERGIGAAVAQMSRDSYFNRYFTPILARIPLVKSYAQFTQEAFDALGDAAARELIASASPIVAKAEADYADAIASGFTWTADKTQPTDPTSPAHILIQTFFESQEDRGGMQTLLQEIARGMFRHGGAFTELIVDRDRVTPLEIKSLDPTTAAFRKRYDRVRGDYYELGQDIDPVTRRVRRNFVRRAFREGPLNFVSLETNRTIKYRALQKSSNNPYGKPLLDPAIFHALLMAGFFTAIQSLIEGQIYPNKHITVDKTKVAERLKGQTRDTLLAKYNEIIEDIKKTTKALKPGDALATGDEVMVGESLSGTGKLGIGSVGEIQDLIRRELIIAVQSQPILMGSNESIAETHANLQLRLYARTIRNGQAIPMAIVQDYMNLALELNGYPPLAEFRLHYENTADYKDQSMTFQSFREGLLAASQDMQQFVVALDNAKESGYISEQQAQEMWDEGMELRRSLNIIPSDL